MAFTTPGAISPASQHFRAALSNIPGSDLTLALLLVTAVGQGLPDPSDKDSRRILPRKDCSKTKGMGTELAISPQNTLTENTESIHRKLLFTCKSLVTFQLIF